MQPETRTGPEQLLTEARAGSDECVTVLPLLTPDQHRFPPDGEARHLDVLANAGPREITLTGSRCWGPNWKSPPTANP